MANEEDPSKVDKQAALAALGKRLVQDQAKQRKARLAPGQQAAAAPTPPPDSGPSYIDFDAPPMAAADEIDVVLKENAPPRAAAVTTPRLEDSAPPGTRAPVVASPALEAPRKIPTRKVEEPKTDILGTISQVAMYVVPVVLAIALFVGVIAMGRSQVLEAQAVSVAANDAFIRTVEGKSEALIGSLAGVGANTGALNALREKFIASEPGRDKEKAAHELVSALESEARRAEVAKPAEARGLVNQATAMSNAETKAKQAEVAWRESTTTILGRAATTFRAAPRPPDP